MSDSLHDRGKAIEDIFFAENDRKLLEKMRKEMEEQEISEALKNVTGIEDESVLHELAENGIKPESLTSVALIPLVAVAWSDNKMEPAEVKAILKAAAEAGVEKGTASYETMESWLKTKPKPELLHAWKAYVHALKETLDDVAFSQLKHSVLGRAEDVAKAAGGLLGLGSKVSHSEQKVINELTKAFD